MTDQKELCVGCLPLINDNQNIFTKFFNMQIKKVRIMDAFVKNYATQ